MSPTNIPIPTSTMTVTGVLPVASDDESRTNSLASVAAVPSLLTVSTYDDGIPSSLASPQGLASPEGTITSRIALEPVAVEVAETISTVPVPVEVSVQENSSLVADSPRVEAPKIHEPEDSPANTKSAKVVPKRAMCPTVILIPF